MRSNWKNVILRDICDIVQYGYTASSSKEKIGPKFLRITDIVPNVIDWSTVPYCKIDKEKIEKYLLEKDDIVIARTGATTGYAKQIRENRHAIFASYLVRLQLNNSVNKRFIGYIVQSNEYKNFIKASASGAAQPSANAQILTSFPIQLPPLEIQDKIAYILSCFDNLIEVNLKRIKVLEEVAQNLYSEWFVQLRYPGHKKAEIVQTPYGPKPARWEIEKLSDLVVTQYGYTESATNEPVGPKFLRGMDINKRSFIDWPEVPYCTIDKNNHNKFSLKKGDILVIRMADPGKAGMIEDEIDSVFASYLVRLKIQSGKISPYYLYYFLLSDKYQGYISGASTGTTRKSASASVLTGTHILIPPRETLERFERIISELRNLLNRLVEKNSALRQMRDLMLQKLISGEIDLSEFGINVSGD